MKTRCPESFEVVFVDGRSTDGTPALISAEAAALGLDNVIVDVSSGPKGYGADIRQGLLRARGALLAWTHADLQCDIADVFEALAIYRQAGGGRILVKGDRKGRPAFDRFFTAGMELLNWAVTRRRVSDINAQPKLIPGSLCEMMLSRPSPDDFSFDLHVLNIALASGYRIVTFPVDMEARRHGIAKGGGGGLRIKLRLARRTAAYILSQSGLS